MANNLHDEENIKLRTQTFMSSYTDLHQDINGGIAFIYQIFLEGSATALLRLWNSKCNLTDVF